MQKTHRHRLSKKEIAMHGRPGWRQLRTPKRLLVCPMPHCENGEMRHTSPHVTSGLTSHQSWQLPGPPLHIGSSHSLATVLSLNSQWLEALPSSMSRATEMSHTMTIHSDMAHAAFVGGLMCFPSGGQSKGDLHDYYIFFKLADGLRRRIDILLLPGRRKRGQDGDGELRC